MRLAGVRVSERIEFAFSILQTMAKKLQLGYRDIEQRLADSFSGSVLASEVGYHLLYSFGKSERDIQRFKEGKEVLKTFDGLLIKGLFCYRAALTRQLTEELELLKTNYQVKQAAPKIVAVSDGKAIVAYDLREKDTYENPLERLPSDFAFFYPLIGVERVHYVDENPADIKAAEKLAKLHDELRAYNEFRSNDDLHDLNIFITRLLFCFFAEDTGIFDPNLFTASIQRYTKPDGSDLSQYLDETFNIMDISFRQRSINSIVKQFPYVNGGLFSKRIQIPRMGAKARRLIIECGELDWKDINPDIFGSMIQAVVNPEERANQGMHYTSVPNIMKVINPLFMDELRGEYNRLNEQCEQRHQMLELDAITAQQFYDDMKPIIRKCKELLKRMSQMKFFDPACGSGNFLIITYKCLRFLEMDILRLQQKCTPQGELLLVDASVIQLNQFYGIELLDFPHEVAMLSLWLAEHQMNTKLNEDFGVNTRALPLKNITQIVCGNACRIDWNKVCPHTPDEEVFVFGNPPYLGSSMQDKSQKADLAHVCGKFQNYKNLDYIANWFYLGTLYIKGSKAKCAFVSTNSICQGEQVQLLWPNVLSKEIEIAFAHTSFKWQNNAKYNAGVTCVIIGLQVHNESQKSIFSEAKVIKTNHINAYLLPSSDIYVKPVSESISGLPIMDYGNKPVDGTNLRLDKYAVEEILSYNPNDKKFIRPYTGSEEIINGIEKYCLWIYDSDREEAEKNHFIKKRIDACRIMRLASKDSGANQLATRPHQFRDMRESKNHCLVIPRVSSERRKYIPIGYCQPQIIVSDSAFVQFTGLVFVFGLISSQMHMRWIRFAAGRLKTDYRYSNTLVYNTFPFPNISKEKKQEIESAAEEVLITRENYPEKTLAELYDPDKMPQDLREAHARLDDIVESCYPGYPFATDEARLECLFKLYEKMTAKH